MASSSNAYINLLIQPDEPSRGQYRSVVYRIMANPCELIFDEQAENQLLLDAESVIGRLEKLLQAFDSSSASQPVADKIVTNLLIPIVTSSHDLGLSKATNILILGLHIVLKYPNPNLRRLGKAVSETEALLELLISHKQGSEIMKDWVGNQYSSICEFSVLRAFTHRLVTLCSHCTHDHGTRDQSEQWQQLLELRELLQNLKEGFAKTRIINDRDKDANQKVKMSQHPLVPEIPTEVSTALASFGIQSRPTSERMVDTILQRLESETTSSILKSIVVSFPCRLCHETFDGTCALGDHHLKRDDERLITPAFNPEIFGKRLGVWKVLLSSQAVKNAQSASRSGMSQSLEEKFKVLASGGWSEAIFKRFVGSEAQKRRMKVPIRTMKCSKLFVLWQIGVGIYDDLDTVSQLVIIWQIVNFNERDRAIEQIIGLQRVHGLEVCKQCNIVPLSQNGTYLPVRFSQAEEETPPVLPISFDSTQEIEDGLIKLSNKFYNLTEPLLGSLLRELIFEVPFELTPEELRIVSHFTTSTLILGRSGTGKTTCLVFKLLAQFQARRLISEEEPIRQVLLTRSLYLASKLNSYIRSLIKSQVPNSSAGGFLNGNDTLSDAADISIDTKMTLFSPKMRFPLVCTFDQFLAILQNTIKAECHDDFGDADPDKRQRRVLDFNVFKTEYWCRLPKNLIKSDSPNLVFAEIMGVIKGSLLAAKTLTALSREEYVHTSCRMAPAFSSELERNRVYSIFERYEKLKFDANDIDQVDRVRNMLSMIRTQNKSDSRLGYAFEEIYVDEIQDLKCLDIVLLMHTIKNARGIHLAGDTAQCISSDSSFRFAEVKDLFYSQYASTSEKTNQDDLSKPVLFTLRKNYRSHQGILSLASKVMTMLWTGFPDMVDKLPPEVGQIMGPKPLMFVGFDASVLSANMIGLVKLSDRLSDFGAEQVIIVRDDETKSNLQAELGSMALILTILESKGMEFDDVLVYNFFSSSDKSTSYRSLHLLLGNGKEFDAKKHAALCSELKYLYVAVTRARKQLWLLESSKERTAPIVEVLEQIASPALVEIVGQTDENLIEKLAVLRAGATTDPKLWAGRASQFMQQTNYTSALFCFNKAGDSRGSLSARAFLKETDGKNCKAKGDRNGYSSCLQEAVKLFLQVDLIENACQCLKQLGDYDGAAELWFSREEYEKAAQLYRLAKSYQAASNCHHLDGNYDKAAEALHLGNLYDQLVVYLSENNESVQLDRRQKYSRLSNFLLKQGRISTNLKRICIDLLGSESEKEQFYRDFEMTQELATMYKEQKRDRELYYLLIEDGHLEPALQLALTGNLHESIPNGEIEQAFDLIQAEKLHRGVDDNFDPGPQLREYNSCPASLLITATHWKVAASIFATAQSGEIETKTLTGVNDNAIRKCLCFLTTALSSEFIKQMTQIKYFPFEILRETIALIQRLGSQMDSSDVKGLFLACGVFTTPSGKEICLPWSPLWAAKPADTIESISVLAFRYVSNKLSAGIAIFADKTRELWSEKRPACIDYISDSVYRYCPREHKGIKCTYPHTIIGWEECEAKIAKLLSILSVFSGIYRLYSMKFMDYHFQSTYLSRQRFWLELLFKELVFVSAFQQFPSGLTTVISSLYHEKRFQPIASSLEHHLLYRLQNEWDERKSFTSLLTDYQLSIQMRSWVSRRVWGVIWERTRPNSNASAFQVVRQSVPQYTFICLSSFRSLRFAAFNSNYSALGFYLTEFLQGLDSVPNVTSLSDFPSLTSVFEFTATYLLYARSSSRVISIPYSWVAMHLTPILMHSSPASASISDSSRRDACTEILLRLVCRYCDLLRRTDRGLTYTNGVRKVPRNLVQHRNMDFLAVIALNLEGEKSPAPAWRERWREIKNIFSVYSSATHHLQQTENIKAFSHSFISGYKDYNYKDWLIVYAPQKGQRMPAFMQGLLDTEKVLPIHLSDVQDAVRDRSISDGICTGDQRQETSSANENSAKGDGQTDTQEAVAAAVIQRFFRKHYPRVKQAKAFYQTDEGRIIRAYLDMFSVTISEKKPQNVTIRGHFLGKGAELQMGMTAITKDLRPLREKMQIFINDTKISPDRLGFLIELREQMQSLDSSVSKLRSYWSTDTLRKQSWWLDVLRLKEELFRDAIELGKLRSLLESILREYKKQVASS